MSIVDKKTKELGSLDALLVEPAARQRDVGYADTLREILQQPTTWRSTAAQLREGVSTHIAQALARMDGPLVLTGSGSSMYIAECLAPLLQNSLVRDTRAIPSGTLLTHWRSMLPTRPGLLVSLARSGDSPESCGVVDTLIAQAPDWRHLVITCNADGRLATRYADNRQVSVLVLDERTNDRSLVMTSSFTNLLLAGLGLRRGGVSEATTGQAAAAAETIFERYADALAGLARKDIDSVVYLGSGGALGAAHESALKMLEMTGGQVVTMAETFLGLRHGPMSLLRPSTLVVAFLSPDPAVRLYEQDLLQELSRKDLGRTRLLVGEAIPAALAGPDDVAIDLPTATQDAEVPSLLAGVVAGQLLAFFRCLALGYKPDAPSQGVLTRVVESFAIHGGDA